MSNPPPRLLPSQRIAQLALFLMAAIAISGGTLQMTLGQPDTTPRLDNVHRFMAGIYLGCGFIAAWAGATIRRQSELVWLLAVAVFLAAIGRLVSMSQVGLPQPAALWWTYLGAELLLPLVLVLAQVATGRARASTAPDRSDAPAR
jgi:peptidoglycan/LPS O-acetylase OafA/YrhL